MINNNYFKAFITLKCKSGIDSNFSSATMDLICIFDICMWSISFKEAPCSDSFVTDQCIHELLPSEIDLHSQKFPNVFTRAGEAGNDKNVATGRDFGELRSIVINEEAWDAAPLVVNCGPLLFTVKASSYELHPFIIYEMAGKLLHSW